MNTLIKTLPLALLLALAGGAAAADPPTESAATPAPAPRMAARHMDPAAMTERMTRHLGLSPEQAREVEQINERFATRSRSIASRPNPCARRTGKPCTRSARNAMRN